MATWQARRDRQRYWLKPFDPDASYVANRILPLAGVTYAKDEVIPSGVVPARRMRMLYEARRIKMIENGHASLSEDPVAVPELKIVHKGRGKFVVEDMDGIRHCEPCSKLEAEKQKVRILQDAKFRADRAAQLGRQASSDSGNGAVHAGVPVGKVEGAQGS